MYFKFQESRLFLSIILGTCAIFFLLLFRDPFSTRTLIPNMEPFPDTFHYVTSARSLIDGEGLNIVREGRKMTPSVAPLYSLILAPFYIFTKDPRAFYFTNIFLSITSFILFYVITRKLVNSRVILVFLLMLYSTNYFLYWYPTLAMAENLILPLSLLGIVLLLNNVTILSAVCAAFVAIAFYATKYASIPLMVSLSLAYLLRIIFTKRSQLNLGKYMVVYICSLLIFFGIFFSFEYSRGNNILNAVSSFKNMILPQTNPGIVNSTASTTSLSWFSTSFIQTNLRHYLNAISGGSEKFLWDFTPLVPKFIAVMGLLGLLGSLFFKKYRFIGFVLVFLLGSSILFISNFYSVDIRYIYHAIPILLLGFGLFLTILSQEMKKRKMIGLFYIFIFILLGYYLMTSALRIKNQIMLNLRYAETPWYYISILEMNKYFTPDKIVDGKRPVVISAMPPYLVDFYSNGHYQLLPLSLEQEFRKQWAVVWGENDYSDLIKLYKQYIGKGYTVYVSRYGIGNEDYLNFEFDNLPRFFRLNKVVTACYEQCNIYKLELKD